MPGLELHSDFDRDGRLTRSEAERAARLLWPGAVVVPNMDRDQRRLPASVSNASMVEPDYDLATMTYGDDELLQVEIHAAPGALQPAETLHLVCSGMMHPRVTLLDDTGRIVPHRLRSPEIYELPTMPASGVMLLTLQVRTIAGARFGRVSDVDVTFRPDSDDEDGRFTLTLLRREASGAEHREDEGRFSVAPFILADRTAPARRLYMVRTPNNVGSVSDVRRAAQAARVPLVEIGHELSGGDKWIQDQYQHALMQGPHGWTELILHLPRLRLDSTAAAVTDNLEKVVDTHFRSRDVGLYRDLWDRELPMRTEDGGVVRPSFRGLEAWVKRAGRVSYVSNLLNLYAADADPNWRPREATGWVDVLIHLDSELTRVHRALDGARSEASSYQRRQQLEAEKAAASTLVNNVKADFPLSDRGSSDPVIESELAGQRVRFRASVIEKLLDRADQMHASQNYGGNIESTPPVRDAPLGKIILGNATQQETRRELVDPDLLRVFGRQRKQPIVEIDTGWLKVGHVDEMMAVVPSSRASGGFVVLHASSKAATRLLQAAEARYLSGLPEKHPDRSRAQGGRSPSGVMSRLMIAGTAPVTRLFRGKAWLHVHKRERYGEQSSGLEPPKIYHRLCQALGSSTDETGFNVHRIGYVPGEGEDRRYPADITASELLWAEADRNGTSSNDFYDSFALERSRQILRAALPDIDLLPIPVIFDRTNDVEAFRRGFEGATTAFSPDMVNLEFLNGHLLVPKPYGPRMRIDDAIAVVQETMTVLEMPGHVKARVGRRLVASRRMTQADYWVEKVAPAYLTSNIGTIRASYGGMWNKGDVVAAFRDSFPDADATEQERRICEPNRRHFRAEGELKENFSLFRIDDGLVDIFELFVAAIAVALNLRLHFVDSWAYHLADGEIHCGTNVLRDRPSLSPALPNVWDAPNHAFRTQKIEFEEERVSGTPP